MGLVLTVQTGSKIYFNDTQVSVERIRSFHSLDLVVHGAAMNQKFLVNNESATEIMPNVKVLAVRSSHKSTIPAVKLQIEAPKHITILREKLYLKSRQNDGSNKTV